MAVQYGGCESWRGIGAVHGNWLGPGWGSHCRHIAVAASFLQDHLTRSGTSDRKVQFRVERDECDAEHDVRISYIQFCKTVYDLHSLMALSPCPRSREECSAL